MYLGNCPDIQIIIGQSTFDAIFHDTVWKKYIDIT